MTHILAIEEAITELENKSSTPPTAAQADLMTALNAADTFAHDNESNTTAIEAIEDCAASIKGYLSVVSVPIDNRLQGYADELNGLVS